MEAYLAGQANGITLLLFIIAGAIVLLAGSIKDDGRGRR